MCAPRMVDAKNPLLKGKSYREVATAAGFKVGTPTPGTSPGTPSVSPSPSPSENAPEAPPVNAPVRRISRSNRMSIRTGGSGLSVPL